MMRFDKERFDEILDNEKIIIKIIVKILKDKK